MTAIVPPGYDTERAQAGMRMIIAAITIAYSLLLHQQAQLEIGQAHQVFLLELLFCCSSLLFWADIRRRPGNHPLRRLLTMSSDYLCLTLMLVLGEAVMLPLYAVLIWITVSYGLRYGSGYLLLATAMATASLLAITLVSSYWQSQPYLVITLLLSILAVPAYIHTLLKRSRQASEAEQAATQAKAQFLAQASHDLRQPIHAISLFTVCLRDSNLDTEQRRLVENIDKSLHSVARLFRSILDMYSLDSGKVAPQMEPLALQPLLQQLVQQNAEAARWAGVDLRLRCSPVHVHADHGMLITMLQNLISNALKYAAGRPLLIGCRRRGDRLSIEVYDKGNGIGESHLESVFEEFYRVRRAGDSDIEGMGLGLAIVRRLGALMQLQVRIHSVEGRGTVAAIDGLQRVAKPVSSTPSDHATLHPPRMLHGMRVCLIENDRSVLLATATLLKKWGCEVVISHSLPSLDDEVDLVLTDFDLGMETTGVDCIRHIRALAGRDVPAIVMTGHDARRVQEEIAEEEIPVLCKPVRPAELRSLLLSVKAKYKAA